MIDCEFTSDWRAPGVPLEHFWEHTVGSCHAALALRADWQDQLKRCRHELGFRRVRFHGLLHDDVGVLVRWREQLVHSFFNADRIVEALLDLDVRPFVELSFMPEVLASGPETVFHYRGNVTPPRDPAAWGDLVRRLAAHWVDRFGLAEVARWYFEAWNEPNLEVFWAGTQADYFTLYEQTAHALKGVDGSLRVGGPATAKDLREWADKARGQVRGRPLLYTEWNCSSNPRYEPQDEPYAAAFVVKTILEMAGLVECYSFWTFSDLFEENYFPSVPFHGGFGLLNLHGIPKPTYHAFAILHRLGDELLPTTGRHETVDVWAVRGHDMGTVVLTNHALPRQAIATRQVRVQLANTPPVRAAWLERIDAEHANAKRLWQELGSPEYLTAGQVERLRAGSALRREAMNLRHEGEQRFCELSLLPHGVAAITLEFEPEGGGSSPGRLPAGAR
jgi:xylan 1,4-beta-xylosidase